MVSLITSLRSATTNVIISETGFRDFVPVAITLLQLFKNNGYFSGRVRNIFHSDIQGQTRPNGLVDFVSWKNFNLFEESTRIPFIFRVPGQQASVNPTNGIVEMLDIYPTIVELCGLKTLINCMDPVLCLC